MSDTTLHRHDKRLVDRARGMVDLVQKRYPNIRIRHSDVMRMALSRGLDVLATDDDTTERG